jgi:hypothetical protein
MKRTKQKPARRLKGDSADAYTRVWSGEYANTHSKSYGTCGTSKNTTATASSPIRRLRAVTSPR